MTRSMDNNPKSFEEKAGELISRLVARILVVAVVMVPIYALTQCDGPRDPMDDFNYQIHRP